MAIKNDDSPREQSRLSTSHSNGNNGTVDKELPDHIDLLLKLIIAQRSPYGLSQSQARDLREYFDEVQRRIKLQMESPQMPRAGEQPNTTNGNKASPEQANGDGRAETEEANHSTKIDGKPNENDMNGDSADNPIALSIANKIRRLNRT